MGVQPVLDLLNTAIPRQHISFMVKVSPGGGIAKFFPGVLLSPPRPGRDGLARMCRYQIMSLA